MFGGSYFGRSYFGQGYGLNTYAINGASGSYTLTGGAAGSQSRQLNALTGTYTFTGNAATLTSTGHAPIPPAAGGGQPISAWFVEEFGGRSGRSAIAGIVEEEPRRVPPPKPKPLPKLPAPVVHEHHAARMVPLALTVQFHDATLSRGLTAEEDERELMDIIELAMQALDR